MTTSLALITLIILHRSTSVLVINQVTPEDDGQYYCMSRDFVNGDLDNELTVQDRMRLFVRTRARQPHQPTGARPLKMNKRKFGAGPRRKGPNRQRQKMLIQESLARSQQTTSISTLIKYLTTSTSPTPVISSTFIPLSDFKKNLMTSSMKQISGGRPVKAYVKCDPAENTCMNAGVCYITNPNFYSDLEFYNQIKIKYCM